MLPCLNKVMERVVNKRLEYVVEQNQLLHKTQSGFRKGQGTMDILMRVEHIIRRTLSHSEICIIIYLDLKSAFDKIWGKGLIYKMAQKGIKGNY